MSRRRCWCRTLAAALDVETRRVQFTPDLMPGDITGSMVIEGGGRELTFRQGPVFTNLLLADEINRTPPKTQSALLEAMEEGQVSADGRTHTLPTPFLVAATQNPVEYEGTYPLPEAQLDRFLLKVSLPLPDRRDELAIVRRHADGFDPHDIAAAGVGKVADAAHIRAGAAAVRSVRVSDDVAGYIVDIARATRESPSLSLGVSPRGATALMRTARAWAWLQRPRLRHSRRREGTGPRDARAPAVACDPRPSSKVSPSARCSPPHSGRCRSRADGRSRWRVPVLVLLGIGPVLLRPEGSTVWAWLGLVLLLVAVGRSARPRALRAPRRTTPGRPGPAGRAGFDHPASSPAPARRTVRGVVRDAWQPSAGASGNRHRLHLAPSASVALHQQPATRPDAATS